MNTYKLLLQYVLNNGEIRINRTGVNTLGVFGAAFEHNLRLGFPLLTTKKIHFKSVVYELIWFLRGLTNIHWLQERGVTIWDEWADSKGEVGPVYGKQWRNWNKDLLDRDGSSWAVDQAVDQIAQLVHDLKHNPNSRRHIVTAWNPCELEDQKLPCCHVMFQCNVTNDKHLDLQMYQRSADLFLGVPFNIASYALLIHILCNSCNLKPGILRICFGDLHIYENHLSQVDEQLSRHCRPLPTLALNADTGLAPWDIEYDHVQLLNYDPHPAIKAQVAI